MKYAVVRDISPSRAAAVAIGDDPDIHRDDHCDDGRMAVLRIIENDTTTTVAVGDRVVLVDGEVAK